MNYKVWGGKNMPYSKHVIICADNADQALEHVRKHIYKDACAVQPYESIPLNDLSIGAKYRWTAADGKFSEIVSIDEIIGNSAKVTLLCRGKLYIGSSNQLYI